MLVPFVSLGRASGRKSMRAPGTQAGTFAMRLADKAAGGQVESLNVYSRSKTFKTLQVEIVNVL